MITGSYILVLILKLLSITIGLAGVVTGTVIHSIKKYPENGKKTLVVSCLSGNPHLL